MSRGQKARTIENFPRMRVRGKRRRRSKWVPIGVTARVGNNIIWTWTAEDA